MVFLAVSPAMMFSCISRPSSRMDSAAFRKAKRCSLTWSRAPRASRQKTSKPSKAKTEEHNCPQREFAAGGCFLGWGVNKLREVGVLHKRRLSNQAVPRAYRKTIPTTLGPVMARGRTDLGLRVKSSFAWWRLVNPFPGAAKLTRRTESGLFGDTFHVEPRLAKQFLGISDA